MTYLHEHTVLVQAVTDLGAGYWMLTPLRSAEGWLVLVNRGFVSTRATDGLKAGSLTVNTVTGLLRMTEPGGAFLRKNAPAENRWHSRDVAAIAAAQGLPAIAPYFIDADRPADAAGVRQAQPAGIVDAASATAPVAGLTVIAFADNHLVYALTWYALALMVAGASVTLRLAGRRRQRRDSESRRSKDSDNEIDRKTEDGRRD
jgi:surfeit locus 1 family protein